MVRRIGHHQAQRAEIRHFSAITSSCLSVLISTLISAIPTQLHADSMRCGSKLVRNGDSGQAVLKRCGKPAYTDSASERIRVSGGYETVRVKRWYYKKRSRGLQRVVLIYRGNVVGIRNGRR